MTGIIYIITSVFLHGKMGDPPEPVIPLDVSKKYNHHLSPSQSGEESECLGGNMRFSYSAEFFYKEKHGKRRENPRQADRSLVTTSRMATL